MIVDECHLVNPKEGMYRDFFKAIRCKIIGLTATPYRLYSTRNGAVLRFITNTSPRVFSRLLFFVQIGYLFGQGYLAKLNYYRIPLIDLNRLRRNSTGADYTDDSVQREYRRVSFNDGVLNIVRRLLRVNRRGIRCSLGSWRRLSTFPTACRVWRLSCRRIRRKRSASASSPTSRRDESRSSRMSAC